MRCRQRSGFCSRSWRGGSSAGWCPICRADEPLIKSRIENSGLPIAGFRVNYDTEAELKAKYKIPYQHTTVFYSFRYCR